MIGYFARHQTGATLLMLVFIALGVLALPKLQREIYPTFESSTIRVSARYAGAPAEVVDDAVTQRLFAALAGLEGVTRIDSRSSEGSASLSLEVDPEADFDALLEEAEAAVATVRDLPDEVDPPTVSGTRGGRGASVATVAVTGPMSPQDLKLYCEQLKRDLLRGGVVTQVAIAGFSTRRLRVRANQPLLVHHGLTLSDLSSAIASQSLDAPIGTLEALEGDLLIRYADKRTTPEALSDVVVKSTATGGLVRLGDVATVEDAFANDAEQTWFNGQRAGLLNVSKTTTQDSLTVLAAVEAFIEDQADRKPTGVTLTLTSDEVSVISDRLALLVDNGLQGLVLVFVTLWLFFGWRMAFWVAASLPVSFLGALWVMTELGQTLNMMTAMGLLIALGLLMDDGIVLADSVAAHLQRGKSPMRAAVEGVREVAGGVFSSFLTTICIFVPLSNIEGQIGRTLQVIPVALITVLAVSLLEAFFILPSHLGHAIRSPATHPPGRFRRAFDARFSWLRDRLVGRAVDLGLRYRYFTTGALIAVTIASVGMITSGHLKFSSFPSAEGDLVQFKLELPPGTPLEDTQRIVDGVVAAAWRASEAFAADQPDGAPLVRNASVRYNHNPDVDETGPHVATVSIDLLSVEVRGTTLADFTAAWRDEAGDIPRAVTATYGAGGRRGPRRAALEVRIEGEDLDRMSEVSEEIRAWLSQFEGVNDVADDLQPGGSQVSVRLRGDAGAMSLTGAAVASQLRAALAGLTVESLFDRGEAYELFVELHHGYRDSVADLEHFPIRLPAGGSVPLGAIAHVTTDQSFARITRVNGARTVTVRAGVDDQVVNAAELARRFAQDVAPDLESRFGDVRLVLGGEIEQSAQTLGSMGRGFILGLLGIFVLLSLQFRTYLEPVLVMLAVPFAVIGVVWGLTLIGSPLTTQGILGFISLAGVVVNDSILLISFIKSHRRAGVSAAQAAASASRDRFRAVLLTSLTTVVGLVPLTFETSRQAQELIPMATAIIFGITSSTLLILFGLPAIYVVLSDLGLIGAPPHDADAEHDALAPTAPGAEVRQAS